MKNLSLAFNIVVLLLIGSLFWLFFSSKKGSDGGDSQNGAGKFASAKGRILKIAHVNVDSLNAKYQCMLDFKREIESRQNSIQADYETKAKALQDEYVIYQQKAQAGTISQVDMDKAQKKMQQEKNVIDNLQRMHEDLLKEAQDREAQILTLVQRYVANYNKKSHFDYILAYAKTGSNILYANDSLDITRDIISGLNTEYTDSLKKVPAAKPH
ncbi:MAG TPA: OmpH family outer membrane protein [Bacteroidia bacterium]|jgi:outer membrane protein|nr:OmpH family outer membrane protein [Bacteroidia bacterium]